MMNRLEDVLLELLPAFFLTMIAAVIVLMGLTLRVAYLRAFSGCP